MVQRREVKKAVVSLALRKVALGIIAIGLGGCEALVTDVPYVLSDGSVKGGEPRLKPLVEMMSKGRPKPTSNSKRRVYYAVSIYPLGCLVLLKGTFPETKDAVAGDYSIACSVDSAETAEVALIVEVEITSDAALIVTQGSEVFRWEKGQWVESSIADIYMACGEDNRLWGHHTHFPQVLGNSESLRLGDLGYLISGATIPFFGISFFGIWGHHTDYEL